MPKRFPLMVLAIALVAICLASATAFAQFGESKGNLYGKVVDEQGGVLPGVTVTLSGQGAPTIATTDARGEFRFLNLSPGTYTVKLDLTGFAVVTRENVVVQLGRNTEIRESLKLSSVAAAVTVTSETPVIDTRKVETGAVMTNEELRSIPTGRDPWVLLQSVPGVMVDRVNVAGSESGQQSAFNSKGTSAGTFTVDGVNFTDMNALGASNGYYDFETFQEVQIVTGGSDPAMQGAGAHINMITKRGTNDVHGSARINYVSDHFQGTNYPPSAGRRKIDSVQEYGIEVGGPIIKDTLWLWGSYGRNQINILVGAATPPTKSNTTLENFNGKLNWQVIPSNSFNAWYQHSDKIVFGRGAGATRPQAATTDQTLPLNNWKAEDSQVVSSNFFFSAMYSGANGFFGLTPEGQGQLYYDANERLSGHVAVLPGADPAAVPVEGRRLLLLQHRQHRTRAEGGLHYLNVNTNYAFRQPGQPGSGEQPESGSQGRRIRQHVWMRRNDENCIPAAGIFRDGAIAPTAQYFGAYLGDTMTFDRLTVQVGVRWDQQFGANARDGRGGESLVSRHPSRDRLPGRSQGLHVERLVSARGPDVRAGTEPRHGAQGELRALRRRARHGDDRVHESARQLGRRLLPLERHQPQQHRRRGRSGSRPAQPLRTTATILGDPASVSSPNAIDPNIKAGTPTSSSAVSTTRSRRALRSARPTRTASTTTRSWDCRMTRLPERSSGTPTTSSTGR